MNIKSNRRGFSLYIKYLDKKFNIMHKYFPKPLKMIFLGFSFVFSFSRNVLSLLKHTHKFIDRNKTRTKNIRISLKLLEFLDTRVQFSDLKKVIENKRKEIGNANKIYKEKNGDLFKQKLSKEMYKEKNIKIQKR